MTNANVHANLAVHLAIENSVGSVAAAVPWPDV